MSKELLSPEEKANALATSRRADVSVQAKVSTSEGFISPDAEFPAFFEILDEVSNRFVERTKAGAVSAEELKAEDKYYEFVNLTIDALWGREIPPVERPRLCELLRAYQFGYGALEDYMRMDEIEEIYFNRYDQGFYIVAGKKYRFDKQIFRSSKDLEGFVRKIATENEREINSQKPNLDATLKDGSRLNATLEPLAVDGPDFVIRLHRKKQFTMESLVASGLMPGEVSEMIRGWVLGGYNILVCGGTGSGKTTLLNAIGNTFIPRDDRVLVVENRKELQIETEDCKYYQTKEDPTKPNEETDVTVKDLVRQTLRKRPDRTIVGEIRGAEAFDAMTAWNSGSDGSLSTIHSNSAWECVSRLQQLCGFSAARPSEAAVRELISQSIDIIIHVTRQKNTSQRLVTEIIQVLHPLKYDYTNQEMVRFIDEMMSQQKIMQQREGFDDIWIAPLFRRGSDGVLAHLMNPVPLLNR